MVPCVPGHGPTGRRLTPTLLAVALLASATIARAGGAGADAPPPGEESAPPPGAPGEPEPLAVFPAAPADDPSQLLTADVASEQGLQVKTILVARSITAAFPQIDSMVGVRPDSRPWHPNGLAIDVMVPNPGSAEGVALGDQIVTYALRNADRFALQDVIWRGTYHTPAGPARDGYGHYEHVHITTFGGGHPTGDEQYLRADEATAGQPPPPAEAPPPADDAAPASGEAPPPQ